MSDKKLSKDFFLNLERDILEKEESVKNDLDTFFSSFEYCVRAYLNRNVEKLLSNANFRKTKISIDNPNYGECDAIVFCIDELINKTIQYLLIEHIYTDDYHSSPKDKVFKIIFDKIFKYDKNEVFLNLNSRNMFYGFFLQKDYSKGSDCFSTVLKNYTFRDIPFIDSSKLGEHIIDLSICYLIVIKNIFCEVLKEILENKIKIKENCNGEKEKLYVLLRQV